MYIDSIVEFQGPLSQPAVNLMCKRSSHLRTHSRGGVV